MDRAATQALNYERLEKLASLAPPDVQKTYFDVSAIESHQVTPAQANWKDSLRKYLEDARLLEEPWTARIAVTLDKKRLVQTTKLDLEHFSVAVIFLLPTLLKKRQLPVKDQLRVLFPERQKKTVFVMLDTEIFWDGPFLCVTDWIRMQNLSHSDAAFTEATRRAELIQQECVWQGVERIYLPDFLDVTHAAGECRELSGWLGSLRGTLSLFAIANVVELESKRTQLTFWGVNKREIALNSLGLLNENMADGCSALYSWVYREVPHPAAALRISRNLVAQQLGPDPESNVRTLEVRLPDISASAKANYAAFMQERLKDFFELGKEISAYTNSEAEYLYKVLGDLNDSLRKSLFTTLGVVGGALLSTTAAQLNPMTYTAILVAYGVFLVFFNVWYLPHEAAGEVAEHLRRFRNSTDPYREFLSADQRQEVFEKIPLQNQAKFVKTRRLVRGVNCALAGVILCLSSYDVASIAKYFRFVPTWGLGRAINWFFGWFFAHAIHSL